MKMEHNHVYRKVEKEWEEKIETLELEYIFDMKLNNGARYCGYIDKDGNRHGPGS